MKYFFCVICFNIITEWALAQEDKLSFYVNTYAEATADFKNRAEKAGCQWQNYPFTTINSEQYNIDYATCFPKNNFQQIIWVVSGIHGIEGFFGSAVQRYWLSELQSGPQNIGFIFIHGLNPFGFKNERRVNENNVDLNRNFLIQTADFSSTNNNYGKIDTFLNPKDPVISGLSSKIGFYLESIYLILKYSMSTLRSSILEGQYDHPKGIFFGGQRHQPQKDFIDLLIQKYRSLANSHFMIDLHTGYGTRGTLHLLSGAESVSEKEQQKSIFAPYTIDFTSDKNFYRTKGDLITYWQSQLQSKPATGITFEYGTMNSLSTLGSVESLYRTVKENQAWQHTEKSSEAYQQYRNLFKEMFYPQDPDWRQSGLKQAKEYQLKLFSSFSSPNGTEVH